MTRDAAARRLLPDDAATVLSRLGQAIADRRVRPPIVEEAVAALMRLPPEMVGRVDGAIADLAQLDWRTGDRLPLALWQGLHANMFGLLDKFPALAAVFLFHRNGYVRQKAVEMMDTPPASPFVLAALCLRMNDWVREVRLTARYTGERLLPLTAPEVVASAAPFLLDRWRRWARWDEPSAAIVDRALQRPDVAALLARHFCDRTHGPLSTQLRYALRGVSLDGYLDTLATSAVVPAVRAVAYAALVRSRADWPVGFEKQWTDKRYNLYRRVIVMESRAISHDLPLPDLIRRGLADRTAALRRIAADALIEHRAEIADIGALAAILLSDRSPSIRERGEFLTRALAGQVAFLDKAPP